MEIKKENLSMKLQAGVVTLPDDEKKCVASLCIEFLQKKNDQKHLVLMIDSSFSMISIMQRVIEECCKFIDILTEKDFVSLIEFSGTASIISACVQCDNEGKLFLKDQLNSELRVKDSTNFSEAFNLAAQAVVQMQVNTISHCILFTDGCSSASEDEDFTKYAADKLSELKVSLSVVGFGNNYDNSFLTKLVNVKTNSGIFRHVSETDELFDVLQDILSVLTKTDSASIDLSLYPNSTIIRVYRTLPEIRLVSENTDVMLQGVFDQKVEFLIETFNPCTQLGVEGDINGISVDITLSPDNLSADNKENYLRVLGAQAFLAGEYENATRLLQLTSEGILTESVFTKRERRESRDSLRRMFRNKKFIGASDPKACVLNVLRELIEDENNIVYLPAKAYKRAGLLSKDPNVIESPHGKTLQVIGYKTSETRFNFSLLCTKLVKVRINSRIEDRKVFRTYNIIRDGNLVITELDAVLSEKTFEKLQDAKVIDKDLEYDLAATYKIDFRNMAVVRRVWANPHNLGLVNLLVEKADLKAEQTELNSRIKELIKDNDISQNGEDSDGIPFYDEKPVLVHKSYETYSVRCLEFRLMKYKPREYDVSKMPYQELRDRIKEVRQRLTVVRYLIRAISFAMDVTESTSYQWDEGKTVQRGANLKLEQNATVIVEDKEFKLKKVTWTEMVTCS